MDKIKQGEIVARKSYGADIIFIVEKIIHSERDIALLKGITVRIMADAYLDDLIRIETKEVNENLRNLNNKIKQSIEDSNKSKISYLFKNISKNRNVINSGKILHLDGDRRYSEKSNRYYKKKGLNAIVKNISESKQPLIVGQLLKKIKPDILIITGHDGMIKNGKNYTDLSNYRNSKYFIRTVIEARKIESSGNNLAIFAGACQSFFEAIMAAGANFASSPARILIDFMDPLIIAEKIATTNERKFLTIEDVEAELRDGRKGISGSGVRGKNKV